MPVTPRVEHGDRDVARHRHCPSYDSWPTTQAGADLPGVAELAPARPRQMGGIFDGKERWGESDHTSHTGVRCGSVGSTGVGRRRLPGICPGFLCGF